MTACILACLFGGGSLAADAQMHADGAPLEPAGTIALPDTAGRIDHLAIDLKRKRLFVAELGNDTVDVVDLAARKVIHRISGLDEPQGVVYAPASDRLAIANGGDGSVRVYDGGDYAPRGVVKLDDDADNARLDPASGDAIVGHGNGGLAIIDLRQPERLRDVALPAHPEAFQLTNDRAYINIPDAREIDVVDIGAGKLIAKWPSGALSANFPMALDDSGHATVVFRGQDRLVLLDLASGRIAAAVDTCGDADDVFFDGKRRRFYVSCGSGAIDIVALNQTGLRSVARVATSWGARTSLFAPELDRLFVAERAGLLGSNASIAIFRPTEKQK